MPPDTIPAPTPEWAVRMGRAMERSLANLPYATYEARGAFIAKTLASIRDTTLREAADALKALRPNSEGYRRPEWDNFDFDMPCADAIDKAFTVGAEDILTLTGTAPKEAM